MSPFLRHGHDCLSVCTPLTHVRNISAMRLYGYAVHEIESVPNFQATDDVTNAIANAQRFDGVGISFCSLEK
ncbi:MAG: hypothetical protein ACR2NZ_11350 [Rubripirellula sp.]